VAGEVVSGRADIVYLCAARAARLQFGVRNHKTICEWLADVAIEMDQML